jgi:peroxin-14
MINKNKESQNQSLTELHQELKSLKALLLSRGPNTSSTPTTPLPVLGRPAIPAWQLANSSNISDSPSALTPSLVASPSAAYSPNGKGKETDPSLDETLLP